MPDAESKIEAPSKQSNQNETNEAYMMFLDPAQHSSKDVLDRQTTTKQEQQQFPEVPRLPL